MIAADSTPRSIPPAAWALAVAGAAMVALLFHHPVVAHGTGYAGTLFVVCGFLLYGVIALALTLGPRRPVIAFGVACHALGCAAVGGAMLGDGFVTSRLAGVAIEQGWPHDATAAAFSLIAIAIQVLTKAGLIGMGVGMCCLSWASPRAADGKCRLLAALALPAGLGTALAAASGLRMHPHSLMLLTGVQALWYAGAALTLWRVSR
jgi:hypothetical protein